MRGRCTKCTYIRCRKRGRLRLSAHVQPKWSICCSPTRTNYQCRARFTGASSSMSVRCKCPTGPTYFCWLSSFSLQIYATVKSGSLAVDASIIDSLLDLMAGGVLWFAHWTMQRTNIDKYPIRKLRFQPVGILTFGCIMGTLGFTVESRPTTLSKHMQRYMLRLRVDCPISSGPKEMIEPKLQRDCSCT